MRYENYDPCFPDQPVVDLYLQTWSKLPSFTSKPAFIWTEDEAASAITYEQLNNSVHRISTNLLLHLRRGDTAVILCQPGLDLVEIIFGCQRAGLIAIPISPPNPSFPNDFHHLLRVISQTNPKAAIANQGYMQKVERYVSSCNDSHLSQQLPKLQWIPVEGVRDSPESGMPEPATGLYSGCKADDVYLIQYTSGATGIPKPVLVTAGSAAHNVRAARKAYELHPNSVIVSWLPQYHDCGLMFLLLTIVSGATSVLASPAAFVKRPGIWLELVTRFKATCTPVPSFALPLVLKRGETTAPVNLETLKNLIVINEPIYRASVDEFVKAFRLCGLNPSAMAPSYGLAENCTFVSTAWRSENDHIYALPEFMKLLPSARLEESEEEEDIEILVINEETEEPVEDGNEGEIWISSPSNASGYLGHPSLTREVFYAMAKNRMRKCYVRTGDRGIVIGKERFLFVTGRVSDMIKLRSGREVHPHYVETAAYDSDPRNLRGGCLAAFTSSGNDITVVAELSNGGGGERDFRDLCDGIRKRVMEEERVAVGEVVLVKSGSVPKTTSGKIRRWLAKDSLMRGQMRIMMQMSFKDEGLDLKMRKMKNHANDQEEGIRRVGNKKRGEIAEVSHPAPLLSSL